jgi:hypothetical protein
LLNGFGKFNDFVFYLLLKKVLLSIPKVLKLSLNWFYLNTLLADGKIMICFAREKKAIIFADTND